MSEKIQFIIEMPIPKYLEGNPYDEIEDEFRRYFLSATRMGLYLECAEKYLNTKAHRINDWRDAATQTQVICSR